ncbi:hypothetical protein F511_41312 [Dorcoceras hygrometricum]|uniref:Uncharacterized protein n=1 Tax=Dorcoceras hygrometricum TaxID=472368 RepID=A0A2Z7DHJ0_9LAMI|nr:hypothetical protein F511_41312 [Dorcoceras hygrometricum]
MADGPKDHEPMVVPPIDWLCVDEAHLRYFPAESLALMIDSFDSHHAYHNLKYSMSHDLLFLDCSSY